MESFSNAYLPFLFTLYLLLTKGLMHAGYPIMMQTLSAADLLKLTDCWGPFHELGHNQQRNVWEFKPHTTEATCNLWSVYIAETVLKMNRAEAHRTLRPANRLNRTQKYVEGGRDLKDWNVWVALETYLQVSFFLLSFCFLQDGFIIELLIMRISEKVRL